MAEVLPAYCFGVGTCNEAKVKTVEIPNVQINIDQPKEEKSNVFVVDGKEVELTIMKDSSGQFIVIEKKDSLK